VIANLNKNTNAKISMVFYMLSAYPFAPWFHMKIRKIEQTKLIKKHPYAAFFLDILVIM